MFGGNVLLSNALRVSHAVGESSPIQDWFEAANTPLCLVHTDGGVIAANAAARVLLARGDGFALKADRICAMDARTQDCLIAALRGRRPKLVIGRSADPKKPLLAMVEPNPLAQTAMIRFRRPGMPRISAYYPLAVYLGLSPQQSRVAAEIVAGRSPELIAHKRNLRVTTIRSHLKAIFAKLDVTSQASIVSVLLRNFF